MPIVYLAGAWFIGIAIGPRSSTYPWLWILPFAPLLLFVRTKRPALILLVALCAALLACGMLRGIGAGGSIDPRDLRFIAGTPATLSLEGTVVSDPEQTGNTQSLHLKASRILTSEKEWEPASGIALLILPRFPEYAYGDSLAVSGRLEGANTVAPTAEKDSYWDYLAQMDIRYAMFYPKCELVSHPHGISLVAGLYHVRKSLIMSVQQVLPEPLAALAEGITYGVRSNIPNDIRLAFSRSGTTHLLAVSGMNLTIIAGLVLTLAAAFFGRRFHIHILLAFLSVWLYSWLTGLQPPVIRAAMMASFFLAAELFGRQRSGVVSITSAAAIMVAIDPRLISKLSFQLSFAAMAGLIFIAPPLEDALSRVTDRFITNARLNALARRCSSAISVSIAATAATWPLTTYYFGGFSLAGPIATIISVPVMPATMILTLIVSVVGMVSIPLAQFAAWLLWMPLSYLLLVVNTLGAVPFAYVQNASMKPGLVWLCFITLALSLTPATYWRTFIPVLRNTARFVSRLPLRWTALPLAAAVILVWAVNSTIPDSRLHVSFLDVGQGDAILIKQGSSEILVDGGPDPQALLLALERKMPFWDRSIDAIILTHPDRDHLGGLIEVLQRYRVHTVVSSNLTDGSPLFAEWQSAVNKKAKRNIIARAGLILSFGGGGTAEVIAALPSGTDPSDTNSHSIVSRVRLGDISFLLTGDLPENGERELVLERAAWPSTVLKVAHHGSAGSTGAGFLAAVNPLVAVVSVGASNTYGHPNQLVMDSLESRCHYVFRTDRCGTVEFITDGQRLSVKTDRRSP